MKLVTVLLSLFFVYFVFAQDDNSQSAGSSDIRHLTSVDYFTGFSQYANVHFSPADSDNPSIEDDDRFLDDDVYFPESTSNASQLKWLW